MTRRQQLKRDGSSKASSSETQARASQSRAFDKFPTALAMTKPRRPMRRSILSLILVSIFASLLSHAQSAKPKLNLDEFFNSVSFSSVKVSPDGNSVIIEVEKADWDQQIFRKDLWLYREVSGSSPEALTQLT